MSTLLTLSLMAVGAVLALGILVGAAVTAKRLAWREARASRKLRAVEAGLGLLVTSTGKPREYWINRYVDGIPGDEP
jgi:hypothetical protein